MKEKIEIGKIVRARGLDGTLKVLSGFLPSDFVNLKQVEIDNNFFDVEKLSGKQGSLFVKLKSIKSIEDADKLKDKVIFVRHENIALKNEEYLIDDLINMQVFTNDNKFVGNIKSIENFGSKDVYTTKNKNIEHSFCLVEGLIESVDFKNNKIILNSKVLSEVILWK